MDNELNIPDHIIAKYRERVVVDIERKFRKDKEIRYIIGQSFREAILPEKFPKQLNMLVFFKDPLTKTAFESPFYLTVKKDEITRKGLVAMTIKYYD